MSKTVSEWEKNLNEFLAAGEKDIHTAMAAWALGIPREQVTKGQRDKAKALSYVYLYSNRSVG